MRESIHNGIGDKQMSDMKMSRIGAVLLLIFSLHCSQQHPRVLMSTEAGDILIELYPRQAPITTANFLRYVNEKRYDGAAIYRTVHLKNQPFDSIKIEVIQGGLWNGDEDAAYPAIEHETTQRTGILHQDGVLSMARLEPGTASSEFFICIGDQPELDFGGRRNPDGQGFAAFGRVITGMDVVRAIQQQTANGQNLTPPVRIRSIRKIGGGQAICFGAAH